MALSKGSSQNFIPITDVRDGVAILDDGSMRAILMASSINYALKSEEERKSILYQFQNFLNSLDFSVQVVVQSRELDIRPYLHLLEERLANEMNELMKVQTSQYIEFIKEFTDESDIMTKSFYVVVPYNPAILSGATSGGFLSSINPFGKKKDSEKARTRAQQSFENNRTQLEQRISVVHQGLSASGIRSVQLGTEEIMELYYRIFNPGEGEQIITS